MTKDKEKVFIFQVDECHEYRVTYEVKAKNQTEAREKFNNLKRSILFEGGEDRPHKFGLKQLDADFKKIRHMILSGVREKGEA